MKPLPTLTLLGALAASGCAPDAQARYTLVADVSELMLSVIEPASEVYWDAVGWIVDASGTTEIRPQSDEEWEAVRNAAVVIAESGNLLMLEGRALDMGPWADYSRALTRVGQDAIRAAERRDEQAVFDVGAEVYGVCTDCHARYAVQTLRPNAGTN